MQNSADGFSKLCATRQKRKLRDVLKEVPKSEPADETTKVTGMRKDLLRALALLKPLQREVVLLHDLEGWTHPEIGEALGISEVMSRQYLYLARRDMRAELEQTDLPKKEVPHE